MSSGSGDTNQGTGQLPELTFSTPLSGMKTARTQELGSEAFWSQVVSLRTREVIPGLFLNRGIGLSLIGLEAQRKRSEGRNQLQNSAGFPGPALNRQYTDLIAVSRQGNVSAKLGRPHFGLAAVLEQIQFVSP